MDDSRPGAAPRLAAKLRPASSPAYLLPRPRLMTLLDEATRFPLTLVVAPAGAGKTSLLRAWVDGTAERCVWFTVDEDDEDPVRWWHGILAALRPLAPEAVDTCARILRRPGQVADTVSTLVDALESQPVTDRAVLVIDDLHLA